MLDKLKTIIRGELNLEKLKKNGLIVGSDFHAQQGVIIDHITYEKKQKMKTELSQGIGFII